MKTTLKRHNNEIGDALNYLALPEVFLPNAPDTFPDMTRWLFRSFHEERLRADPLNWGTPKGIAKTSMLFLDHLQREAEGQNVLADVKLNQLYIGEGWAYEATSAPRLIHKMADVGKIIFLRRKNLLRAILSLLHSTKTGVWFAWGDKLFPHQMMRVDAVDIFRRVQTLDRGLAEAERWLKPYPMHHVIYDDLFDAETLACDRQAFDAIADFAGLRTGLDWRTYLRKTGTRPLVEMVENYDQLRNVFLASQYADMLD